MSIRNLLLENIVCVPDLIKPLILLIFLPFQDNLRDPSFVGKIQDLEAKRQGLYVGILRKRGQIVHTQQGDVIVSYPQVS